MKSSSGSPSLLAAWLRQRSWLGASPVSFADVATGVGMTAASDRRRPVRRRTAEGWRAGASTSSKAIVFLPRSWLGSTTATRALAPQR